GTRNGDEATSSLLRLDRPGPPDHRHGIAHAIMPPGGSPAMEQHNPHWRLTRRSGATYCRYIQTCAAGAFRDRFFREAERPPRRIRQQGITPRSGKNCTLRVAEVVWQKIPRRQPLKNP